MEVTGKLHGISRDMVTGQCLVTFAVDDSARAVEQGAKIQGVELNIKATKYRKARSLDATGCCAARSHTRCRQTRIRFITS